MEFSKKIRRARFRHPRSVLSGGCGRDGDGRGGDGEGCSGDGESPRV